jgi:hypothetical protein
LVTEKELSESSDVYASQISGISNCNKCKEDKSRIQANRPTRKVAMTGIVVWTADTSFSVGDLEHFKCLVIVASWAGIAQSL